MHTHVLTRIDLSTGSMSQEDIPEETMRNYLGGRGLGVYSYIRETDPDIEPFDPENSLVFSIGPLVGTTFPTATRISLVSKSPLTNTISSSNMGGYFAPQLRKTGTTVLLITGSIDVLSYLYFDGNKFAITPCPELKGLPVKETEDRLKEKHGKAAILSIGPAGENLVKFASATHNKENDFGRGGLGAVIGSKNLKAIIIEGDRGFKYKVYDKSEVQKFAKEMNKITRESTLYTEYNCLGTNMFGPYYKEIDGLTVNNYTGAIDDKGDQLYGKNLNIYSTKHTACYGCVIACRHHYEIGDCEVLSPEFESIQLLGPHLGIFDPEIVLPMTELVSDLGMDTISAGHAMSTLQYLIRSGKIDKDELTDSDIKTLFFEIANASSELSKEMGLGELPFASHYGAQDEVMHVKGMGFPAYEARAMIGQGLGYGVSSRGGCHIRGGAIVAAEGLSEPIEIDPKTWMGKGKLVSIGTKLVVLIDSIGICLHDYPAYIKLAKLGQYTPNFIRKKFTSVVPSIALALLTATPMKTAVNWITGFEYSEKEFKKVGWRVLTLERMYNNRQGFTKEDDFLTDKLYKKGTPKNEPLNRDKYERELLIYYKSMGWDSEGIPKEETIKKLGLEDILK